MPDPAHLLQAYGEQLRTQAPSAIAVTRHGPLRPTTRLRKAAL